MKIDIDLKKELKSLFGFPNFKGDPVSYTHLRAHET